MILNYNIPGDTFFSIFQLLFSFLSSILGLIFSITIEDVPIAFLFMAVFLLFRLLQFSLNKGGANDND